MSCCTLYHSHASMLAHLPACLPACLPASQPACLLRPFHSAAVEPRSARSNVCQSIAAACFSTAAPFPHRSWFNETLPGAPMHSISFLRLDGDLYASTKDALEALYDKVGGAGQSGRVCVGSDMSRQLHRGNWYESTVARREKGAPLARACGLRDSA